ncbi:MAG TPA: phosphoethanolamine--lipid A transferase [Steroidobacteraceae bacterium]|jgi:lipid A ethanolaminephosphotransferase
MRAEIETPQHNLPYSPGLGASATGATGATGVGGGSARVAPEAASGLAGWLLGWCRRRWAEGIRCSSQTLFAVVVSLLWAAFYNFTFWQETAAAMWYPGAKAAVFFVSLFALVVTTQATLLLLMPTRRLLQAAASGLFIVGAASAYFSSAYGAIMNKDMIRNALETDPAEVGGLISAGLILHLLLLGIVPAILVWRVAMPRTGLLQQTRQRGLFLVLAWVVCGAGLFAASANYAVFFREHKPLRSLVSPAAAVVSTVGVLSDSHRKRYSGPLIDPGGRTQRVGVQGSKPVVLFLVIGETARSADFQLGGYPRTTNPRLSAEPDLTYFSRAASCGTSTAISVPCIFSPLGRSAFDVDKADRYVNLLDTVKSAGVDVQWRDNNAGCKGACARVDTVHYTAKSNPELCPNSYCFDEVMLQDLATRLQSITRDTLIVFHQIGSHGPAYAERYPAQFEKFKPTCKSNELNRCTPEEIVNVYDNTIAYTDHVLARQIDLLRAAAAAVDGVLIYASDHGESLGEQGVYLHGMPYAFAPHFQKEIPLLIWTSSTYRQRVNLDEHCLQAHAQDEASHDDLYHTVLGVLGLRNQVYDAKRDLLAACRRTPA